MEVEISPAPLFNVGKSNITRSIVGQSFEPSSKRFKHDLTFQCMICSDVYNDPNTLYEHMKSQHNELYERSDAEGSAGENGFESDSEHELSDEEYLDLSHLLEPICELRQIDDEDDDDGDGDGDEQSVNQNSNLNFQPANIIAQLMQNNAFNGGQITEEHLKLQLQLQMQLQNHLLQLQMNIAKGETPQLKQIDAKQSNRSLINPMTLREFNIFLWLIFCSGLFKEIIVYIYSSRSRSRTSS